MASMKLANAPKSQCANAPFVKFPEKILVFAKTALTLQWKPNRFGLFKLATQPVYPLSAQNKS
jgi:hypothetical protein